MRLSFSIRLSLLKKCCPDWPHSCLGPLWEAMEWHESKEEDRKNCVRLDQYCVMYNARILYKSLSLYIQIITVYIYIQYTYILKFVESNQHCSFDPDAQHALGYCNGWEHLKLVVHDPDSANYLHRFYVVFGCMFGRFKVNRQRKQKNCVRLEFAARF